MATYPALCCCFFLGLRLFLPRMTHEMRGFLMKTYTLALPTHTGSESLGTLLCCLPGTSLRKSDFPLHPAETKEEAFQGTMGGGRVPGRDWLLLPAPGIWGTSVRLWQAAPGHAPGPPGSGIRRRAFGRAAACLHALAASCALPSQMGEVLHSWLRLEDSRPRHGWAFGETQLL